MNACRLFHDWGKWEDVAVEVRPFVDYIDVPAESALKSYVADGQRCVCKRCGKKKQRIVGSLSDEGKHDNK
jgi:hypothetical protein